MAMIRLGSVVEPEGYDDMMACDSSGSSSLRAMKPCAFIPQNNNASVCPDFGFGEFFMLGQFAGIMFLEPSVHG